MYPKDDTWITVYKGRNLPEVGDTIYHKDTIEKCEVVRVGIVHSIDGALWIKPKYKYDRKNDPMEKPRKVTDGLQWALSRKGE